MLRIAARDLLGADGMEEVAARLSDLAGAVLQAAWLSTAETSRGLAVIGMGKLGGGELNYSSDVDVLLVAADRPNGDANAGRDPDPRPCSTWPAGPGGWTWTCVPKGGPAPWSAPSVPTRPTGTAGPIRGNSRPS